MKQLTAMQELYDELDGFTYQTDTISITDVKRMIGNYYLAKEKEQMIDTFKEAQARHAMEIDMRAEQYYSQTYKND